MKSCLYDITGRMVGDVDVIYFWEPWEEGAQLLESEAAAQKHQARLRNGAIKFKCNLLLKESEYAIDIGSGKFRLGGLMSNGREDGFYVVEGTLSPWN